MPNFLPRRVLDLPPVFSLRIDDFAAPPGAKFDWLSQEEKRLLDTMGSAKRRAQFAAGRWLLHHSAREALGGAAFRVEVRDERPVVAVDGSPAPAAASLSHAADFVLCGVAPSGLLGVDVELVRPRKQWEGIAEFALHPAERRRLSGLAERELWPAFYQLWTLKEALSKALGVGLAMPFNRICLSESGHDGDTRIEDAPSDCGLGDAPWKLGTISMPAGLAAALAWCEKPV
jgi:4'-phosphopantetheinyl transferase